MALIAARHNLSVWAIAQANQSVNPNVLYAGQRLVLPLGEDAAGLPMPFLELNVSPVVANQGQTVRVVVRTDGEAELSGEFGGRPLTFVPDEGAGEGWYRALVGIGGMAGPGPQDLELRAATSKWEASLQSMLHIVQGRFGAQYIQLPAHKTHLLDPAVSAQESERLLQLTSQVTLPGQWQNYFGLPLAVAPAPNAYFGVRRSYNGGLVTVHHTGVDYGVAAGTPVYASASGRVVLAETLNIRGISAIVDHGRGVMTVYSHLSQINVVEGQYVERGAILGLVGTTGRSTGAHLHWELRVMGAPVDPLPWTREYIY
jgi:murein DD-endopeptidase MepM/ murein hydrolase activator NlpD